MTLARSLRRFVLVGGGVTALHVVVAFFLIEAVGVAAPAANIAAFLVANATSFLLHANWSFAAAPSLAAGQRFAVVSVLGLLLTGTISGIVQQLDLHYATGIFLVVVLVPLHNFAWHRYWTFRP